MVSINVEEKKIKGNWLSNLQLLYYRKTQEKMQ